MTSALKLKRTYTASRTFTLGELSEGEIGINVTDKKIYIRDNNNTIVQLNNTSNTAVTLTGDVTGTGTGTIETTLADSGAVAGTYTKVTINSKGIATGATNLASSDVTTALGFTPYNSTNPNNYISANQTITVTGDATGSGTTSINLTLANSGVTAGTYTKVTVGSNGLVTVGANLSASDVTTALTFTPIDVATKGVANGVATLDAGGKIPTSQLPASVTGNLSYQGVWNASTNSPTLVNGTGTKGWYYKVSVAGNTTIDGNTNWTAGDMIIFNGTTWDKAEGGNPDVVSVAGRIGAIVLTTTDIGGLGTIATQNANSVTITGGSITGTSFTGNITGNATNVTGVVAVANGGTGAATLTGYVKGSGTSAMTASATIPVGDITGLGTMATQNAATVSITGGTIDGVTMDCGTYV